MRLVHEGKVRTVFADVDGSLVLVASDRISVFDVVLPSTMPEKGKLLTALSAWWFEQLADVTPNHMISWQGAMTRVRPLTMLPVECVVRSHDRRGQPLPALTFTPTTKAPIGHHDRALGPGELDQLVGPATAAALERTSLRVFAAGKEIAADHGVTLGDAKLEFGTDPEGQLVLADELFTQDSSRMWPVARPVFHLGKQVFREWAAGTDWNRKEPGPMVPEHIIRLAHRRYVDAYERLTDREWH